MQETDSHLEQSSPMTLCGYTAAQLLGFHSHLSPYSKGAYSIFLLFISILKNHEKIMELKSKFLYNLMIKHEDSKEI